MSIQWIARDLYRMKREVERLEEEERSAPKSRRNAVADRLRQARAEYQRLRRVLEGAKTPPEQRRPR
jgi:hypothetical protein